MAKAKADFGAGAGALEKAAAEKGKSIGMRLSEGIAGVGNFAQKLYLNPAKAINESIVGGAADVLSSVPVIGGLLAAPLKAVQAGIGGAIGIYEANADRILALGKGASKAGLDVGDFQLLSRLAGDVDGAAAGWARFSQKLAEAQVAGEGVRTVFDRFGLDGKALANQFETDFAGALGKTFDRINSLPMAMQASAARALLGKRGLEMMPTIAKGSAGIAEEQDRMSRMGLGVDGGLVANVKQAQKAKKEVDALFEGFGNQVTMAVAPALAVISEKVGKLPGGFAGLGETIIDTAGKGAIVVADLIDGWTGDAMAEKLAPYWDKFKELAKEAVTFIGDEIGKMLESKLVQNANLTDNPWLKALIPGLGLGDAAKGARDLMGKKDKEGGLGDTGGGGGGDWGDEAKGKARKGVEDTLAEIKNRFKGKKDEGWKDALAPLRERINKLNDDAGGPVKAFEDAMNNLRTTMNAVEKADPFKAAADGAKDMLGVFDGGLLDGVRQMAEGMGEVEKGAAEMAAFKSFEALKSSVGDDRTKLAGAMEQGSTAAYSAIAQFEANRPEDVQQQIKRLIELQTRIQEEQVKVGKDAIRAFAENRPNKGNF